MHSSNQSDQSADVQRRLPVIDNRASLSEEEDGSGDHCNGDDPERDSDAIVFGQESILRMFNCERRHWSAHTFQLLVHKA
jgi:hypothetical protein